MSIEEGGQLILGISIHGVKFRPSDWSDRIATLFGRFDASRRIRYNPMVMPVRHAGLICLFVACRLVIDDPAAYSFIMDFASSNQLQIIHTGELQEVA